jgi:hypothetical protein
MCLDGPTFFLFMLIYFMILTAPFITLYFIIYFWLKRRNEAREDMESSRLSISS